ncbi:MAG: hypothetical protein ACW99U_11845 [Candidatus Thorarchaeota archaeon]
MASLKIAGIGFVLAAAGYTLMQLIPISWTASPTMASLAVNLQLASFALMGIGGLLVLGGFMKRESDIHREKQLYRAQKYGTCDECGNRISGQAVGCRKCTLVFCSQRCARTHGYVAH